MLYHLCFSGGEDMGGKGDIDDLIFGNAEPIVSER